MINEDYCSYEVAKLLKEKGFNVPTHAFYNPKKSYTLKFDPCLIDRNAGIYVSAPTHQMAMKWLREGHGIFIAINNDDLDFNWQCYDLINRGSTLDPKILSGSYACHKCYEDAVEAALKYCLEDLI